MTSGDTAGFVTDWTVLEAAVRGANKRYSQDSHKVARIGDGAAFVMAVADGHGGPAYHRSHLGARWAVDEFIRCVLPFGAKVVTQEPDASTWAALRSDARQLPKQICRRWRDRALLHDANSPSRGIPDEHGRFAVSVVPYGSTLIGALVTRFQLFLWQLGDGDAVVVRSDGVVEFPLGIDEGFGDETESLCQPEPWRRMRTHWQPLKDMGHNPLVFLSTDGLAKSYADHDGFRRFAHDLHFGLGKRGSARVSDQLPSWLERSANFSGDDTTLIAAYAGG